MIVDSAVRTLARHEARTRWRTLLALGVVTGIFFGAAMATVVLLLRANSAYDRMVTTSGLADARVGTYNVFNDPAREAAVLNGLASARAAVLARPDIVASQQLTAVYARRVSTDVQDLGVWAPKHQWDGLDTPVVVTGRLPAAHRVDEVMVNEQAARTQHLRVGDRIGLDIYQSGQVRDVDSGLPTPGAGRIELIVVGTYRVADSGTGFGGLLAGPAFAARYDATAAIGEILLLRLNKHRSAAPVPTVEQQARRLDAGLTTQFGSGFYNYVDYVAPRASPDPAVGPTRAVLQTGLGVLAGVIALAGLAVAGQLTGRWLSSAQPDHAVVHALGMRGRHQGRARVLAAVPAVGLAAGLTAAGALLGGYFEPPGALNRFEPRPGWLGHPVATVLGALAVVLVVLALVQLAGAALIRTRRAGGSRSRRRVRPDRVVGAPPVASFAIALSARGGDRTAAVRPRTTIVGLVTCLGLLVIVISLGHPLARLEGSPARWGWRANFGVAQDPPALDEELLGDARVRDAEQIVDAPLRLQIGLRTEQLTGYGRLPITGTLPYTMTAGVPPRDDGEIAIGPRTAEESDLHVGDQVQLVPRSGRRVSKRVVGIVVMPTLENEPLGRNVLLTKRALQVNAIATGYSNVLVRAVDQRAAAQLRAELARTVEIEDRDAPTTIVALTRLAGPVRLLEIVLIVGAGLLVAGHVTVLLRRRSGQLAIATAIGMTRRQLVAVTVSSTAGIALVASVTGTLLGWAVSRIVLVEIGPRLGIGLSGPGIMAATVIAVGVVAASGALAAVVAVGRLTPRRVAETSRQLNGPLDLAARGAP